MKRILFICSVSLLLHACNEKKRSERIKSLIVGSSKDLSGTPSPNQFYTQYDNSVTNKHVVVNMFRSNQLTPTTASLQPFEVYTKASHSFGEVKAMYGIISNIEQGGSGTIDRVINVTAGGVIKNSGNIREWKGFTTNLGVDGGTSTVGTAYQFYGQAYPASGVRVINKYGVYIADPAAVNYFAGSVVTNSLATTSYQDKIQTVTSNITLDATHKTILIDATNGNKIIKLPAASNAYNPSNSTGRVYTLKRIDSSGNSVTVHCDGNDTIDGQRIYPLSSGFQLITIQTNGKAWFIIGTSSTL